ncbi:hypothetical protein [Clostridium guangxiense]|uniref:hypothetical protein n=1 Tax=Clostridium guangxiense TaxID=1662055 RepID=UPI001E3F960F|nr:hypothetical protein [Clostridium guangxiense]MCD2345796.1 hypothetical protein [Clostridium guangxiense]
MDIDNIRLYKQEIQKIEQQEKQAILSKKWTELARLSAKREDFKHKIEEIEHKN